MFSMLSLAKALETEPNRSNICPECGNAQVLRWSVLEVEEILL